MFYGENNSKNYHYLSGTILNLKLKFGSILRCSDKSDLKKKTFKFENVNYHQDLK